MYKSSLIAVHCLVLSSKIRMQLLDLILKTLPTKITSSALFFIQLMVTKLLKKKHFLNYTHALRNILLRG
jgi:hypothetical protein